MALKIVRESIPLKADADGVVRVRGTRVTLDTIVAAFHEGATPEEIAQQYPSLQLSDVYSVIGYYLHRRSEVETYLRQRQQRAQQIRQQNEVRFSPAGIRERLQARRKPNT